MTNDGGVTLLHEVAERRLPVARLEPVIGHERYERLMTVAARVRKRLADRTIWNVSSVAVGGGVAEMLQVIVGYVAGADIPIRWTIIGGDPQFFGITKRLPNQIHGADGQAEPVGSADARYYEQGLAANADELLTHVRPGDIAILHDPQTAGLTGALARAGVRVLWRCHIGIDTRTTSPVPPGTSCVPTCRPRTATCLPGGSSRRCGCRAPGPDHPAVDRPVLGQERRARPGERRGDPDHHRDLRRSRTSGPGCFLRDDGSRGTVRRAGLVMGDGRPGPDDPVVVQVSRWDRLKDMAGVMSGFAGYVLPAGDAYLLLVGPSMSGVADDPEGAVVFAECLAQWNQLPPNVRERVLLVTLPLDDVEENAAMVNAIQRRATVIVQKSLAEGFGLTVAEGMWKGRPVVGSAVGGIVDQIVEGTGILLPDPADLATCGSEVGWLLDHRQEAERMGAAGMAYTREHFVGDVHLLRFAELVEATAG